jgi:hypothetical protein
MQIIKCSVILLLLTAVFGCVESFELKVSDYEDYLIVDGFVTNEQGPYYVTLTRSYYYDEKKGDPEQGAIVQILDGKGHIYQLNEQEAGKYASNIADFQGIIGERYKLFIQTKHGEAYESDFVTLKETPPVDRVYYEYQKRDTREGNDKLEGIQIFVDTQDPDNNARYYRWEYEEGWKYTASVSSNEMPDKYVCWAKRNSHAINIKSSDKLTDDVIHKHPLVFISNHTNRLGLRYSILVKQYALSMVAYSFWKDIEDMNEELGGLFDPIPFAVMGNINNLSENSKPALGYFDACAVSKRRIYIDRSDLPSQMSVTTEYESCIVHEIPDTKKERYIEEGFFFVDNYWYNGVFLARVANFPMCFDCTTKGTNVKPDFWID